MNVLQKRNRSIPDGNETAAVLFFLLFIFLKQFYLFPSGGMEAADVCLFASFFMLLCDVSYLKKISYSNPCGLLCFTVHN